FGLLAGRMWHLEDLGPVGTLIRHSTPVREAIHVMVVHQHLNSGGGLAFALRRATIVDFGYAVYYPRIVGADQIVDCMLAAASNMLHDLAGPAWAPSEVFLAHTNRTDSFLYRTVFMCG